MNTACLITRFAFLVTAALPVCAQEKPAPSDWIPLFNGRNLDGWVVKIAGHELGDNFANTFRVEDGVLKVSYDGYAEFGARFGHLFYTTAMPSSAPGSAICFIAGNSRTTSSPQSTVSPASNCAVRRVGLCATAGS